MAILVAGGAGYIGSVTVELLRAAGERVVVLDNLVRGHRASLDPDVPFYQGNVGDCALLTRIASEHQLESCIHFAALTFVGPICEKPCVVLREQRRAGRRDAQCARRSRCPSRRLFLHRGHLRRSSARPHLQSHPQPARKSYGWSKLFLERLLNSFDVAYGLKFVSLRYFNAAGATEKCGEHHDPESHLIPCILQAAVKEPPEVAVFGKNYPTPDGTPVRDYVHVVDLADAHIRALNHLRRGGASDYLNLGTGHGYSVLEVIESARQVTGRDIRIRVEPPRPGDPPQLVADPTKSKAVLDWVPTKSDLRSIIDSAWRWHQRHPRGYDS